MRKNIQEKKLKNETIRNDQKLSQNTKKCIFWVQKSPNFFRGKVPRTPRSLAGFACLFAGWQKFLRRTLRRVICLLLHVAYCVCVCMCIVCGPSWKVRVGEGGDRRGEREREREREKERERERERERESETQREREMTVSWFLVVLARTRTILDDFREGYFWLRHNTHPQARCVLGFVCVAFLLVNAEMWIAQCTERIRNMFIITSV